MADIIPITSAHRGAFLGTASFYRMPSGEIAVMITEMVDHMIESRETIPDRFILFAEWLREGIPDLEAQGKEFADHDSVEQRGQMLEIDSLTIEQQCQLIEALAFYGIPENWHGVYMVGRGPMADDWSEVADPQYPDGKPGKLARETIDALRSRKGETDV